MTDRSINSERRVVTVGFIPLLDCALLVVAHEKGFAEQQGIRLRLVREVSWANVRDRVAFGQGLASRGEIAQAFQHSSRRTGDDRGVEAGDSGGELGAQGAGDLVVRSTRVIVIDAGEAVDL